MTLSGCSSMGGAANAPMAVARQAKAPAAPAASAPKISASGGSKVNMLA